MTVAETVRSRYAEVKDRVAQAAERSGRRAEDILIVAVSKYAELDDIRGLLEMGHADFGESRAQQLVQRAAIVDEWLSRRKSMRRVNASAEEEAKLTGGRFPDEVRWHMIGHLQRNKVRKTLGIVRLTHSVDTGVEPVCRPDEHTVAGKNGVRQQGPDAIASSPQDLDRRSDRLGHRS